MAVPGRRNGLMEEEDHEDDNPLFEENGLDENPLLDENGFETITPPHLCDLASATQLGDLNALRLALVSMNLLRTVTQLSILPAFTVICLVSSFSWKEGLIWRPKMKMGLFLCMTPVQGGFTEIVQLLLDRGTNNGCLRRMLDSLDAEDDTPLHHAARGEHVDVIRLLLAYGASPTKTNTYGMTPRQLADPESEAWRVFEAAAIA